MSDDNYNMCIGYPIITTENGYTGLHHVSIYSILTSLQVGQCYFTHLLFPGSRML
jgi:hypothetical protein